MYNTLLKLVLEGKNVLLTPPVASYTLLTLQMWKRWVCGKGIVVSGKGIVINVMMVMWLWEIERRRT